MVPPMTALLAEGLNLALYGMGTVFIFLTLLVLATMLMSRLVSIKKPTVIRTQKIDSTKIAAISAAVHQHRYKS